MGCGAYRITHVVQDIGHGNQVVVPARKLLGFRNAKVDAIPETLSGGSCATTIDRFIVIVKSEELRIWEGFGHQQSRRTFAAAHIGDARASLELGLYTLQGRNPR